MKYRILTFPEKCTGCLRCQLACSNLFMKVFSPNDSRIQVAISGYDCIISFSDECTACGICADHCFYEALAKTEKEDK